MHRFGMPLSSFPSTIYTNSLRLNGNAQTIPTFPPHAYFQSHANLLLPQDRNIILTQAFEYRFAPSPASDDTAESAERTEPTSRYLGQVVVPGPHISKIELDEFASQVRGFTSASASATGAVAAEKGAGPSTSASANESEKSV
jgi:hypothetical protein